MPTFFFRANYFLKKLQFLSLWPALLLPANQLADHNGWDPRQIKLTGYWDVMDPGTGALKFTAEFYERSGLYHAKVIYLPPDAKLKNCQDCPEPNKNRPLEGMDIIWDLKPSSGEWSGGKIINPEGGNIYDCVVWLDADQSLVVRGFIKLRVFGKSQKWIKRKS